MSDSKPPRKPRGFEKGGAQYRPPRGLGWGGEARGLPTMLQALQAGTLPRPTNEAVSAGHAAAREVREIIGAKRRELAKKLLHLAERGETEEMQLKATNAALDRLLGKPAQAVDVTSDGQALGYVVRAPEPIVDADEWTETHKPG